MILKPIRHMSLEDALWYIGLDELVEVTPQSIRIRKKYLTELERTTARRQWKI
jgi:GTP-binding protein